MKKYLIEDEADKSSENDFGKNIIPKMLKDEQKLYAYNFEGYWKDVGTIDSLWDSNLDLLDPNVPLDVWDESWRIYSRTHNVPPQHIGRTAEIENSMISEGCDIDGFVDFSVLFQSVTVEEGANVRYSVVMPGSVIKKGADVRYAIIGENCVIEEGAKVGQRPEKMEDIEKWGIAVLGNNITVHKGATVEAKAMIYSDVKAGE